MHIRFRYKANMLSLRAKIFAFTSRSKCLSLLAIARMINTASACDSFFFSLCLFRSPFTPFITARLFSLSRACSLYFLFLLYARFICYSEIYSFLLSFLSAILSDTSLSAGKFELHARYIKYKIVLVRIISCSKIIFKVSQHS